MRLVLFPIAALMLLPCSLQAQTDDLAPPADDLAPTALQQSPVQPASVLDVPIAKIADMSGGCAILDRDFPGLRAHPMYPFFKAMTLNQIAAMSKGEITTEMLAQAKIDLAAIDSTAPAMAAVEPKTAQVAVTPVATTSVSTIIPAAQ